MFRQLIFTILILLVLLCLWGGLWLRWKRDLLHSEEYCLNPGRFHLSEHPPWIPETLVHEVLMAAKFGPEESVLDEKLPEKLAVAFAANSWIQKVRSVQIMYPAEVFVDLEYRSPVCLVELPGGHWLYPVDADGVLLPTDYFTRGTEEEIVEKKNAFLLVEGAPSNPIGSFGDPWGDSSVEKAAKLAAKLGANAKTRGITSIKILIAQKDNPSAILWDAQPPKFQVVAADGRVFDWGTFDFSPDHPQLPDLEKAKLEQFQNWLETELEKIPSNEGLSSDSRLILKSRKPGDGVDTDRTIE